MVAIEDRRIDLKRLGERLGAGRLSFGSPEFFMLSILGISFVAALSGEDALKGIVSGGIGLMLATGMPMINAIGTSLLSVGAFGLATALNYAASGLVDWWLAMEFIGGGVAGGLFGTMLATRLSAYKNILDRLFAALIFVVAGYIFYRSLASTPAG